MESRSSSLNQFVSEVVRLHELATGLKRLTSHKEIVAYGQSKGFEFSESDWNIFVVKFFMPLGKATLSMSTFFINRLEIPL